jgi:hypothetical protein
LLNRDCFFLLTKQTSLSSFFGHLAANQLILSLCHAGVTRANTTSGDAIWSLANNGLDFLDSRTEFWRQQKPIYARKNNFANNGDSSANNPLNYVIKRLETIDNRKPPPFLLIRPISSRTMYFIE